MGQSPLLHINDIVSYKSELYKIVAFDQIYHVNHCILEGKDGDLINAPESEVVAPQKIKEYKPCLTWLCWRR